MQHLEHDMDDLFRKAADDYPLKANENKWEDIASHLHDQSYTETGQGKKGKRRKYILSALLLLLFLATGFVLLKNINNNDKAAENKNLPGNESADVNLSLSEKNNDPKNKNDFFNKKNSTSLVISNEKPKPSFSENINQTTRQKEQNNWSNVIKKEEYKTKKRDMSPAFILRKELQKINIPRQTVTIRKLPANNKNDIALQNAIHQNRGIYWGFTAGPQMNEVKSQGMNKTGFDLGILAGYRFNKRISIETGFLFATKNYYSDGKYFKMAPDPSMPPNMTLMSLKGNSKIIEIPVKFKYDFINNGRNNLFSAAGITSYLLTKETNNYHAMVNGSPQDMDKSYNDVTNYTAATFYFSAGYEHRILKRNKIRIEPFLQIPLKGIGVGKMPVTSTGLHLGITWERK
jgi:hypothetical protein